mmetsp:Transcript_20819/g.34330  ORF Transcript_20819/g.34330 Transcript_20819/m.34330 type:complete len:385 (+) Transcript_20819:104-1258(+)
MTQMQMRRQAGWWNRILSLLLRLANLLLATSGLAAAALSLFLIVCMLYLPENQHYSVPPNRRGTDDHTFVRGNNPSKNLSLSSIVDHNGMVKINASLSTMNPLDVWESLIKTSEKKEKKQTVIEVGVHSPKQCIDAAERGYDTHCFEPSPPSYTRIERGIDKITSETRDRIHIYNKAVGATSGQTIPFHSTGGTGDHVGEYDMWRMKRRFESQSEQDLKKRGNIVQVPTICLDDFIAGDDIDGDGVFLLKVDTQGFEPSIFNGLENTVRDASIDFIIFEFWPRGMDLLADTYNECTGHKILDQLISAGYTLYALKVESHPKAPLRSQSLQAEAKTRPYTVEHTTEYCNWFFQLEEKYSDEQYKFGYWSDFLAVAPGVDLPPELN